MTGMENPARDFEAGFGAPLPGALGTALHIRAAAIPGDWEALCPPGQLRALCRWLFRERGCAFATMVVEECENPPGWEISYHFYSPVSGARLRVLVEQKAEARSLPSISDVVHAADWHERETEDLFGLVFEGHPRLGEFILHEDWPEGTNPMRRGFDASRRVEPRHDLVWEPPKVVESEGAFAMPVGPVYSDFAESAHFLLETVGEDVITVIPRLFYKYRGVEKLAEGRSAADALLLAERFSGNTAFAHGLAFCQAAEAVAGTTVPPRASALRSLLAELERLRHHAAAIHALCESTALAVATSQAALIEEELLRLTGGVTGHRYLFGALCLGGVSFDMGADRCRSVSAGAAAGAGKLSDLMQRLTYSSSFLDRIEEVGTITRAQALDYGLVGPVARASNVVSDMRRMRPYAAYGTVDFEVPAEVEGDGYARLRVLFREARQSAAMIGQLAAALPEGAVRGDFAAKPGAALAAVEAPGGAALHWLRLDKAGRVVRWRVTSPGFTNWHGFPLATENFAFQDFPIIMASLGLSNAECDR